MNNSISVEQATLTAWRLFKLGAKLSDERKKLIEDYLTCNEEETTRHLEQLVREAKERQKQEQERQKQEQERQDRLDREEKDRQKQEQERQDRLDREEKDRQDRLDREDDIISPQKTCCSSDVLLSTSNGREEWTAYSNQLANIGDLDIKSLKKEVTVQFIQEKYNLNNVDEDCEATIAECAVVLSNYNGSVTEDQFQNSGILSDFLNKHSKMNMVDMHNKGCIFSELRVPTEDEEFKEEDDGTSTIIDSTKNLAMVFLRDRPDLISKLFPLIVELKSYKDRYKLILQSMKRVCAICENHGGLYHGAACFAMTDDARYCYLITYEDKLVDDDTCERKKFYRVHSINRNDVGRLWLMFTKTPEFFLAQDGGAIVTVLKHLDLNPYCCRITLLSASSSRVYKVVVPKTQEKYRCNINRLEYSFALKINDGDMDRHRREADASMVVGEQHFKQKMPFHVHRILTVENGLMSKDIAIRNCSTSELFGRLNSQHDTRLLNAGLSALDIPARARARTPPTTTDSGHTDNHSVADDGDSGGTTAAADNECYLVNPCADVLKWRYSAAHKNFGAVIMELGESLVSEDLFSPDLRTGVVRSLLLMHEAGYAHCDVRSYNIMKFPQFRGFEYRVIDFDLAVPLENRCFKIDKYSAQYKAFPVVAQDTCGEGNQVTWHSDYDIAMFYEYILRKWR